MKFPTKTKTIAFYTALGVVLTGGVGAVLSGEWQFALTMAVCGGLFGLIFGANS